MSSIKSLEQLINHFEDEPDSRRAEILKDTKIPLGEFTKFTSWKDAVEKLKAGASLVQIYSGFIYEGPGLIKEINQEILAAGL